MTTLSEVRAAQPDWFSRSNKKLFGDKSYSVLHGKISGKPFLVRATEAWTHMFGCKPVLHYRVNPIDPETLKIQPLIVKEFKDRTDVKMWLKTQ